MIEKIDNEWDCDRYPKYWNWEAISMNQNITIEIIENNFDKYWNWKCVLKNPNFTFEMIEKYPTEDWNWDNDISKNEFKKDYENELQKLQNFKKIEEELIQKTWHPHCFQKWCLDND